MISVCEFTFQGSVTQTRHCRSVTSRISPAPPAKNRTTRVTLTTDLFTWRWYATHCPHMGCICATYEYNPWNRHQATVRRRHEGRTDRQTDGVKPLYPANNIVLQDYNYRTMPHVPIHMMTYSNGSIFRVTGHLCGEFTGHRWIPRTKARNAELWNLFFFNCAWKTVE